jgi:nicotinamidase-related amidase
MAVPRLQLNDTALLVVDMQQKLVPAMSGSDALIDRTTRLLDGVNALGLPVLATEQYPRGLGATIDAVAQRLSAAHPPAEKTCFTACIEPIKDALDAVHAHGVIVAGIEAHVCVLQTCLELVDRGYVVGAVRDATASRAEMDREIASRRLQQAGVLPLTVESTLMELIGDAGDSRFKQLRDIIK